MVHELNTGRKLSNVYTCCLSSRGSILKCLWEAAPFSLLIDKWILPSSPACSSACQLSPAPRGLRVFHYGLLGLRLEPMNLHLPGPATLSRLCRKTGFELERLSCWSYGARHREWGRSCRREARHDVEFRQAYPKQHRNLLGLGWKLRKLIL